MIQTATPVSYDPIDLTKKAVVTAQVVTAVRNDETETYTLNIQEFVQLPYSAIVPVFDSNGFETGTESQDFFKKVIVRNHQRSMTFAEADQLTNALDQMFSIEETGTARRKKYTELGHLIINNTENVRNVSWILVSN